MLSGCKKPVRLQLAYAQRERLLPDQIPGYGEIKHGWSALWRRWGASAEAVDMAREMVELPRHPLYNPGIGRGSGYYGRQCLRTILSEYELWDELLSPSTQKTLEASEEDVEQVRQHRCLGRAYFRKGIVQGNATLLWAGREELTALAFQAERKSVLPGGTRMAGGRP